jgi:hypothetical protein
MTTNKIAKDRLIIDRCLRDIPARELSAIIQCTLHSMGERRNIAGILSVADEFMVRREVVAAAFGFLQSGLEPGRFADAFADESAAVLLDRTDKEILAAWVLARGVFGGNALPSMLAVRES